MYEQFYGLRDKPFSMLPDPEFLFLSKKHQSALTLLEYGLMNNVGFCVISGETGAGKTTLLRKLLGRIDDSYRVGMITNTHQSFGSLLDWVLSAFNLHDPDLTQVEMHQKLMDFLIAEYAQKRKVLLIVDEAQNMNAATLEELRMLSNVNSEKDQLMQVILAGQPALRETLKIPELMQFAQRIGVDFHLGDLDVTETCHYIQHRLKTAGAQKNIFTPAACARIYNYSGGVPRLINLLCDTVMVYGFADQQPVIDVDMIDEMVQERMQDSVVPLISPESFTPLTETELEELEKDFPWIEASTPDDGEATGEATGDDMTAPPAQASAPQAAADSGEEESGEGENGSTAKADAAAGRKYINVIEQLEEPEIVPESNAWWIYTGIAVLVVLTVFFILRSDLFAATVLR